MPSLIIEHSGKRSGASLNGRTSIGRGDDSQVIVDHPTVSRVHAWIENEFGAYFITDTGSRNGTFVDGERIDGKKRLRDGALIRVGPARMTFRLAPLKEVAPRLDPVPQPQSLPPGIVFSCPCGAKLWVPEKHAGLTGKCKRCGGRVEFPIAQDLEPVIEASVIEVPAAGPTAAQPTPLAQPAYCSICQCEMYAEDAQHKCPECGLAFHADCWLENKGCSAYGCSQVNVLAPPEENDESLEPMDGELSEHTLSEDRRHPRVSWQLGFLLASVPAGVLGAFLFGLFPLVGAVLAFFCIKRDRRNEKRAIAFSALAVMAAGAIAGFVFSMYFWLKVPPGRWIGRA
jgi:hypothetical protein